MLQHKHRSIRTCLRVFPSVIATAMLGTAIALCAQDTPLISGGGGFITTTNGGNTTYIPIISPLLAAPLGDHLLVESRATIAESYSPRGGGQSGLHELLFLGLSYLQLDYLANRHATLSSYRGITYALRHLQ